MDEGGHPSSSKNYSEHSCRVGPPVRVSEPGRIQRWRGGNRTSGDSEARVSKTLRAAAREDMCVEGA